MNHSSQSGVGSAKFTDKEMKRIRSMMKKRANFMVFFKKLFWVLALLWLILLPACGIMELVYGEPDSRHFHAMLLQLVVFLLFYQWLRDWNLLRRVASLVNWDDLHIQGSTHKDDKALT